MYLDLIVALILVSIPVVILGIAVVREALKQGKQ